jgi:hypothetical protein
MKKREILYLYIAFAMVLGVACKPQSFASEPAPQASSSIITPSSSPDEATENSTPSSAPAVTEMIPITSHLMKPPDIAPTPRKMVDDVESSGTGPEGRAPYGDSYKLNRFERPFLKDMTYVADIDIHKFGLSEDEDWYYISIQLLGNDPNNTLGINYGAEIDLDADGFGDYVIWTHPPYTAQWDTSTVQVFKDSNRDSGGESALQSDANFEGNGYDTLVFDGGTSENADPDLAWVRMNGDLKATIQFAFKKSLTGRSFMVGAVSDAGLKDITKFDYNDYFRETDAGSPIQSKEHYPLGLVYAVDNTCWEAHEIATTGYEPKLCQPIVQPITTNNPQDDDDELPPMACDPQSCGGLPYDPVTCECA